MEPASAPPRRSVGVRLYSYFRSSASYRVRIALHHKQLPFELVPVALYRDEHRTAEHRARNPLAQVPVLELRRGDSTMHIAQSLAIIEYLEERHPQHPLLPRDLLLRAHARELAELVNAGIQPLQSSAITRLIRDELKGDAVGFSRAAVQRGLEALAQRARQTAGKFLVGDEVSIADVCLVPQLHNARRFGVSFEQLEQLLDIDARCRTLPGWELAHPDRQPDAVEGIPHGN
jgi:maleylpyruvate isomerase